MISIPTTLTTFSALLGLAAALPSPASSFCPTSQSPTKAQFIAGYTAFCSLYIAPSPIITSQAPILATFDLTNTDGTRSQWVYKISIESDGPDERYIQTLEYRLVEATCLDYFNQFLNADKAGQSWCLNSSAFGAGNVQVLEGNTVDKGQRAERDPSGGQSWAWVQYSSFRKTGTKAQ